MDLGLAVAEALLKMTSTLRQIFLRNEVDVVHPLLHLRARPESPSDLETQPRSKSVKVETLDGESKVSDLLKACASLNSKRLASKKCPPESEPLFRLTDWNASKGQNPLPESKISRRRQQLLKGCVSFR
jgi:hypothetical protein